MHCNEQIWSQAKGFAQTHSHIDAYSCWRNLFTHISKAFHDASKTNEEIHCADKNNKNLKILLGRQLYP